MSRDDSALSINQHGDVESELPDAGADLLYLLLAVSARITRVKRELRQREILD
jgi:hypothetical protein